MKNVAGLWIDHTQAVVIMGIDPDEVVELIRIISTIARHVRYSSHAHTGTVGEAREGGTEAGRDRLLDNLLNRYYDRVILNLRDATAILLLGPGVAKYEVQKRMEVHGLSDRIVAIQTAGEMTDEQLAAEVRLYFQQPQPNHRS